MRKHWLHKDRFIFAGIFAFAFAIVGWIVPNTYYKYFDKTVYYSVVQPVSINKTVYKPCEETILTTTRTSLIDTNILFTRYLRLVRVEDNAQIVIDEAINKSEIGVKKGIMTVSRALKLPCNLIDGNYFWQAVAVYQYKGNQKTYTYVTENFSVRTTGVSENVENFINQ